MLQAVGLRRLRSPRIYCTARVIASCGHRIVLPNYGLQHSLACNPFRFVRNALVELGALVCRHVQLKT